MPSDIFRSIYSHDPVTRALSVSAKLPNPGQPMQPKAGQESRVVADPGFAYTRFKGGIVGIVVNPPQSGLDL